MSALDTGVRARLAGLLGLAERSDRFAELAARIEARERVLLTDANGGARAFAWSAVVARLGRTLLLVAPSEERARRWRSELAAWLGEDRVLLFPERETMPFEASAPSQSSVHQRLVALWRMRGVPPGGSGVPPGGSQGEALAVVAPLRAVLQHTIAPGDLAERARVVRPGDRLPWRETALWLTGIGYEPVPEVGEPGELSRRGGIVDVYPSGAERPVRIELFGDDVETIRAFDPVTQRSQDPLDGVTILPAREISLEAGPKLADRLAELGWERLSRVPPAGPSGGVEGSGVPPTGPSGGVGGSADEALAPYATVVEPLRQRAYVPGLESFAPLLGAGASLVDHLPARSTVVLEDTVELDLAWDTHEQLAEERREELRGQGLAVAAFPAPYVGRDRIERAAEERGLVRIGAGRDAVALGWGSVTSYAGRLDAFLRDVAGSGTDTRVVATPQAARVADLLGERDVFASPREDLPDPPADGALVILHVPLAEGFALPDLAVRVFTDAEIFGFRKPRHPVRRRRRIAIGSLLADLKPGDHVVHEDRGIALFERFTEKEVVGVLREYLELRFADGITSLPTERIDKITRYLGGTPPSLSAIGGSDWLKTKRKAKRAAEDIARELLRLYAERETIQATALPPDTPWQVELENAFPFTETPDQLQAIEETKRDLERPRPMDRLVVGDVGYGKTEVALRAAFKAVQDGKQVAVLVPTTVLAQQHFETFSERLETFPVKVEMLSRFRTPPEQREIVDRLVTGDVDVVIGTHRALQKDVRFRDLGLVVIDEEHRFGVKHKERLKQMRTQVHVLSLTATPIPRTLHMALSGIRDISVIETPPEDRQPIETHVIEKTHEVLREAIHRELDRGGQVYYVHDRVMGIEQETERLRKLAPQASFVVAHGQMHERQLERVMVGFADGDYDVLVCTTIIESGLDIPNVNTIVIDRAGQLGLAQLYQLRGRVGRSAEKAFAYLLYDKHERLGDDARKRLQAVFEASELGAGFKIAMHDLEIRGAGNLLGAEQHGHVAAVGFELYTQLLQASIEELRGLPRAAELPEITVDLALSTAIPDDYVPSRQRKLETYRRIAELRELEELVALREELRDRYGAPPEPVRNLLYGVEVKLRAIRAGAVEVRTRGPELRVALGADIPEPKRLAVRQAFPRAQIGQRQIRISVLDVRGDWRDALTRLLSALVPPGAEPEAPERRGRAAGPDRGVPPREGRN